MVLVLTETAIEGPNKFSDSDLQIPLSVIKNRVGQYLYYFAMLFWGTNMSSWGSRPYPAPPKIKPGTVADLFAAKFEACINPETAKVLPRHLY